MAKKKAQPQEVPAESEERYDEHLEATGVMISVRLDGLVYARLKAAAYVERLTLTCIVNSAVAKEIEAVEDRMDVRDWKDYEQAVHAELDEKGYGCEDIDRFISTLESNRQVRESQVH